MRNGFVVGGINTVMFAARNFGAGEARATRIPFMGLQGARNESCGEKDCRPQGCVALGLGRCCSSVAAPLWGMFPPRA